MPSRLLIGLFASLAAILATSAGADDKINAGDDCAHIFAETGIPEMEGDTAQNDQGHVFICRKGYAANFNTVTHNPDWVAEDVTAKEIRGQASRKDNFTEDKDFPPPAINPSRLCGKWFRSRPSGASRGQEQPGPHRRKLLIDEYGAADRPMLQPPRLGAA